MPDVTSVPKTNDNTPNLPLFGSHNALCSAGHPTVLIAGHAAIARVTNKAATTSNTSHAARPKNPTTKRSASWAPLSRTAVVVVRGSEAISMLSVATELLGCFLLLQRRRCAGLLPVGAPPPETRRDGAGQASKIGCPPAPFPLPPARLQATRHSALGRRRTDQPSQASGTGP